MSVDGVVNHGPQDIGDDETRSRYDSMFAQWVDIERSTAHKDRPGEREAQHKLRVVGDALHQSVDREQHVDANSMIGAGGWKHGEEWYLRQQQGHSK